MDLQEEIDMLEASLERETKKIYTNLKPWDRVQIARLQERPTTGTIFHISLICLWNYMVIVILEMIQQ